jgi:hypothetical protein
VLTTCRLAEYLSWYSPQRLGEHPFVLLAPAKAATQNHSHVDLLIIIERWGFTSPYHAVIETLFAAHQTAVHALGMDDGCLRARCVVASINNHRRKQQEPALTVALATVLGLHMRRASEIAPAVYKRVCVGQLLGLRPVHHPAVNAYALRCVPSTLVSIHTPESHCLAPRPHQLAMCWQVL